MDPVTRTTETTPKSPLSVFLSDLLGERFGSMSKIIVVDNARSHAPSIADRTNSGRFDSDSIARTSSSSSSSRWDPNVFSASSTERHTISGDNGLCKSHGPEPSLLGSSYDIPTAPVRRDSPGKWRTKQALFGTTKKDKLRTPLVRGSDEPPASVESSILPPPYPIRQASLQPSNFPKSNSDAESKAKRSYGTKASSKPRDICPPPYPVRQASLPTPAFLQPESEPKPFMKSRKKLKASSGTKADTDRETKKKKKSKKTKKSRRKVEEKAKKKGSFQHSPRSERVSLKLSEPRSPRTPTKLRKYLRKSLPPKKKTAKERSKHEAVANDILSPLPPFSRKSSAPVLVSPEGHSLGSAFKSLPTSATSTKSSVHSTRLKFHSDEKRPANHRSLSETLLSCDRDTIEPSSTTLPQDRKRSPPARPIRQLSRALFEL